MNISSIENLPFIVSNSITPAHGDAAACGRPSRLFDDGRLLILRGAIDVRNARLRMSGRIIGRSMGRGAMQVAILEQPRKFVVRERPVPRAEAGEVVVRIAATAVCHT